MKYISMKYLLASAFLGVCFLIDLMPIKSDTTKVSVSFEKKDTLPHYIKTQNEQIKRFESIRLKRDTIIKMKLNEAENKLKNSL